MIKYRYFNNNIGPEKVNEVRALKTAFQICDKEEGIEEIILLIHTKRNTGYIERIFETRDMKPFFNGVKVDQKYPSLRIETIRTFNNYFDSKVIIICFGLRSEEIYNYEDYEGVVGIVAHQWVDPDVQNWAKTYGAINIDTGESIEKTKLPNMVVQNAFRDLTQSINMSTGIMHSDDNNRCKTYIRALREYKYELNSHEIFSFLTSELNWDIDNVKDVIKLIDKVNSGGYFQGGSKTGLKFHIKQWQK